MLMRKTIGERYTVDVYTNMVVINGSMPVPELVSLCTLYNSMGYTKIIHGDQYSTMRLTKEDI